MRKLYAILAVLTLVLSIGVTAMAQGKEARKTARKAGCSDCAKCDVTPEQMSTFKRDTIDLRQELMNKRFDLQREQLKETPDSAKTAALEGEIAAVKEKIDAKRKAANLPESICTDRDCPLMAGDCGKCAEGKGCACDCCKKAGSCDTCKKCKKGECPQCRECKNCMKTAECAKCTTKKQPAKAGCSKCNKK